MIYLNDFHDGREGVRLLSFFIYLAIMNTHNVDKAQQGPTGSATRAELAAFYQVSTDTFRRWLKQELPHLATHKGTLTPAMVAEIRNTFG